MEKIKPFWLALYLTATISMWVRISVDLADKSEGDWFNVLNAALAFFFTYQFIRGLKGEL